MPALQAVRQLTKFVCLLAVIPRGGDVEHADDREPPAFGLLDECEMLRTGVLVGIADSLPKGASLVE